MTQNPENAAKTSTAVDNLLQAMAWRCIGPPRGGRVVTVAGDPINLAVFYFGACAGGVWKTTDAGITWHNVSDGYFKTASVGAIAVAPSDPNVIYAGMGEATIRLDVSHGDGVYKSTDAGETWTHIGLSDTRHIGKVRVHPQNPDIVFVAALGHAFGSNEERGVFRSMDGGQSWEKVLYKSENAGAIDLSMDPNNPRILYASIWEGRRSFWHLSSGGPESGLYKSTDGGDTWTELTNNPGMPDGLKGKIGVAVSPAKNGRVWALVEAKEGRLLRSDDGGSTWQKMSDRADLRFRPWYFSHVIADPQNPDTVHILNVDSWVSVDGGQNFTKVPTPHGDNHDLWIDPNNPQRRIQGDDGGAFISFNGGETWSTIYNQLTAQFYRLAVDNHFPYRVYSTQQDNTSISVPSRTDSGAITWSNCLIAGTGESGFIAAHPENPNIGYVGAVGSSPGGGAALQRYNLENGRVQLINVWPEATTGYGPKDHKYRFPWTFPILFSPHDSNVLYTAGNIIFKTTNEGQSWEAISPDLTRNDESKLGPSGGPITKDTTGAEDYATISSLVESIHEPGVFWAGSDDGLVHISKNGGQSWQNITPDELPEWSYIHTIEQSPHDPATAYMAATRYKIDDNRPYLYKTNDYGQSWQKITNGIPDDDFTRVIRADPGRPGLLYAGTETGLYLSFDDGDSWQRWQSDFPVVPVYDMLVKEQDLVVATHGRSFWILDDLTPLYQVPDQESQPDLQLYKPRNAYRFIPGLTDYWFEGEGKEYHSGFGSPAIYMRQKSDVTGQTERTFYDAGKSAPTGVQVKYYLAQKPDEGIEISLSCLDADGNLIKRFTPKPPEKELEKKKDTPQADEGPWLPAAPGVNVFQWDMRYPKATKVPGDKTIDAELRGPIAVPGTYQVQLTVGDKILTESFEIISDPRISTTQAELEAQFDLLLKIRDKLSETHNAVNLIRDVKKQIDEWQHRVKNQGGNQTISKAAEQVKKNLDAIADTLAVPADFVEARAMDYPARLNSKLAGVLGVVDSADSAPTKQSYEVFELLSAQVDEQLSNLQEVITTDVAAFSDLVKDVPAIVPMSKGQS